MNTPQVADHRYHRRDAKRSQAHQRACTRGLVAVTLLTLWVLTLLTGLLIALSPLGPHAGQIVLGLLSRARLRNLHLWLGLLTSAVVILHVVLDWRTLLACLRHLTPDTHPAQEPS